MADSKRQKIVSAIVARMQGIDGTGDYTFDLNGHVGDSRTDWDAGDDETGRASELPAVSVFDGDANANPSSPNPRSTIHAMSVLIRGFTARGETAANARNLIKDIQRAIRVDDKWHVSGTPLAMQTRQVRDSIVRSADSFEVEGCEVEIEVQFQTEKFNAEA